MNNSTVVTFSTKDSVFQATNLIFSLYILVSLLVYQIKIESKKSKTRENIVLNVVCFFNALCAFVCVTKDLPILYMETKPELFCLLMVDIAGGVPYFLGVSSAFGMLWYRQRKLYSNPIMKLYVFKWFNAINYLLLVCFLLLMVTITVAFLYESSWLQGESNCMQIFAGKMNMVAMTASYCVLTVICQVTLFMFISYPIICTLLKKNKQVTADLKKMLKRLLLCTLGCCISSLQINLFILLVERNHVYLYWPNFAGLDLIITTVCVIGTFGNWQKRLFPFCSNEVERRPSIVDLNTMKVIQYETSTNVNKINVEKSNIIKQ